MDSKENRIGDNDRLPEELDAMVKFLEENYSWLENDYFEEAEECWGHAQELLQQGQLNEDEAVEEATLSFRFRFGSLLSKFDKPSLE